MTTTLKLTEAQFTRQVIQLAQLMGFKVAHFRPAQTSKGWRTAVSGDGVGFPDLVLVRGREIYFWELKVKPNRASTAQAEWIEALQDARVKAQVLYPEQWEWIQETLMRKP